MTDRQTGSVGVTVDLDRRPGITLNRQIGGLGVTIDLKPIPSVIVSTTQSQTVSLQTVYVPAPPLVPSWIPARARVTAQKWFFVSGTTYSLTVTATQTVSVSLRFNTFVGTLLALTQAQAVSLIRAIPRTLVTTQAQVGALRMTRSLVRAVTQSQALALTAGRINTRIVSATLSQSLALRRAVSLRRTVTQSSIIGLLGGSSRTLAVTQTQTVRLARAAELARLATVAQSVVGSIGHGYQRTLSTTQSVIALRIPRLFRITVSLTTKPKPFLQAQQVRLGPLVLGRVRSTTEATSPRLVRQVRLTRTVTQASSARIVGLPVKLTIVSTVQARSLALGQFVRLTLSTFQRTAATLPRVLRLAPSVVVQELLGRQQAISLTRQLVQPTAVSIVANNVTPRLFIILTTTLGQQVALASAGAGKTSKTFVVSVRDGNFVIGHRESQFSVGRRGVRFTVEER